MIYFSGGFCFGFGLFDIVRSDASMLMFLFQQIRSNVQQVHFSVEANTEPVYRKMANALLSSATSIRSKD